jgi:CelD/BcsL family acetyltransferase involved in cellulose biosynthesis
MGREDMVGAKDSGHATDHTGEVEFPDLRAVMHCDDSNGRLSRELPERYSSCFSTPEYFALYDNPPSVCVCEFHDPRHVIFFSPRGRTVDVLNKLIDIEPDVVVRLAQAVFRAYPRVDRIRLEIKFPPEELHGALRVRLRNDDLVVPLPATQEEYRAGLGRRTRQNINQYSNRLERRYPDFRLSKLEKDEIPFSLVEQVAAWNRERMHRKGTVSLYEVNPEKLVPLWRLLRSYGVALCGHIGDECVAAQLFLHVGHETWVHTVGFESDFEDVHLGLLMAYFTVLESIERGCSRMHMLWGTPTYKQRLGAQPVPAYQVSLFRAVPFKAVYAYEGWHKDEPTRIYWRLRKRLKKTVDSLVRPAEPSETPGGDHG